MFAGTREGMKRMMFSGGIGLHEIPYHIQNPLSRI